MTMEKFDARLIIQPAHFPPGPNFQNVQSWISTTSRSRSVTTGIFLPAVADRADVGSFRNLLRPTKLFRNRETSWLGIHRSLPCATLSSLFRARARASKKIALRYPAKASAFSAGAITEIVKLTLLSKM